MSEATYKGIQDAIKQTNDKLDIGKIGNIGKSALLLIGTITSGGLPSSIGESEQLFFLFIIMAIWLIAIYLARHILAGHKIRMRDGLYNALSPAISTLCILCIIIFELIPIFIVIITYSSALATDFLATPFYALVYFIFASLMILLSLYLLPGGIMALVAISAPGLYPVVAINTANDLIIGRRIKFIIRLVFMCISLAIFWIVIMLPIILLDLWLKTSFTWLSGIPLVPICLLTLTIFSLIYFAIYCYLFYRELLDLE